MDSLPPVIQKNQHIVISLLIIWKGLCNQKRVIHGKLQESNSGLTLSLGKLVLIMKVIKYRKLDVVFILL